MEIDNISIERLVKRLGKSPDSDRRQEIRNFSSKNFKITTF